MTNQEFLETLVPGDYLLEGTLLVKILATVGRAFEYKRIASSYTLGAFDTCDTWWDWGALDKKYLSANTTLTIMTEAEAVAYILEN